MPYNIEVKEREGYILVDQSGEVSVTEVDEIRTRVFELVGIHRLLKVLVDVRKITNELSVTESFNVTVDHVKFKTSFPKPRACLIVRPDQYEAAKFIQTVGENRGLPIKTFTDLDAGLRWLFAK